MRRSAVLVLLVALLATAVPLASAATPRTSLSALETEVMCVLCKVPLQVAGDAPQAVAEREFIKGLIARGQTKAQIKAALVAQYGPAVLANPPTSGFSLSAYVIPIVAVVVALVLLALTLPRWRRRGGVRGGARSGGRAPSRRGSGAVRPLARRRRRTASTITSATAIGTVAGSSLTTKNSRSNAALRTNTSSATGAIRTPADASTAPMTPAMNRSP